MHRSDNGFRAGYTRSRIKSCYNKTVPCGDNKPGTKGVCRMGIHCAFWHHEDAKAGMLMNRHADEPVALDVQDT